MTKPIFPSDIRLLQKSRQVLISFDDEQQFRYPCALLRKKSPAADNNPSDPIAADINITAMIPIGHYAIRLVFNDGHDTGIYSWGMLYALGLEQKTKSADSE